MIGPGRNGMHILFFNPQGNFDRKDSHLTEHPDFGGQLVYVKEVAMAMVEAGHRVDIVTRRIIDPDWPEFSEQISHYDSHAPGLRIVRISCGGDDFLAKEQLWEHMDEFVAGTIEFYGDTLPDFVTAHYADGGYCAVLMQSRTGLRYTLTGHSLGAQKMDKLGMNSVNAAEMEQRFRFSKRIAAERSAMQQAFQIITSTGQERMKQYAHPLYAGAVDVHDDAKFSVIPPGVNSKVFSTEAGECDQPVFQKLSSGLNHPDQPHLLVASRIDEKKNIGGAVAAYVKSPELQKKAGFVICTRGIDRPFEQIGSLTEEEQDVLKPILEMISAANLRDRVEFLDIQSQAELAATYRYFAARKSVFVLPSFYEPFGLAPIEAVACGLSCAATSKGGPTEIFADGSAVLIDPTDIDDMAGGMEEALENHEGLAARARERVLDMYTWKKTAARYLSVIEQGMENGLEAGGEVPELDASQRIKTYLGQAERL
jgi:sucrose-phosphate synthase